MKQNRATRSIRRILTGGPDSQSVEVRGGPVAEMNVAWKWSRNVEPLTFCVLLRCHVDGKEEEERRSCVTTFPLEQGDALVSAISWTKYPKRSFYTAIQIDLRFGGGIERGKWIPVESFFK